MTDVFGRMVTDYYHGDLDEQPVYRRSDGDTSPAHCAWYFADPGEWGAFERNAVARTRGRVVDVGCGVGRTMLWLTARDHETVGIDASPGAVRIARERGLRAVVGDMERLPCARNAVQTALFVGTHIGAVATPGGFRDLLAELDRIVAPGGRVVADCYDPALVEADDLREYLADRWIEPGVATRRFRLEYDGVSGPWLTLLLATPGALDDLADPTCWTVATVDRGEDTRYFVVLEREGEVA